MSTLETLMNFHNGEGTLGYMLKASLEQDPVKPVLVDDHFEAIDRRVGLILKIMRECINGAEHLEEVIFSHDDLYDSGSDAVENDKAFNRWWLEKKIRFFFLSKSFKNQAVILTTLCQERLLNQKIDNQAIAKKT